MIKYLNNYRKIQLFYELYNVGDALKTTNILVICVKHHFQTYNVFRLYRHFFAFTLFCWVVGVPIKTRKLITNFVTYIISRTSRHGRDYQLQLQL